MGPRTNTNLWGCQSLVATIHFSPFTGGCFTDFLLIQGFFPQQEGSFCPFTYSLGNHSRMLHSLTPFTRIHSLHPCEYWPLSVRVSAVRNRKLEPSEQFQRRALYGPMPVYTRTFREIWEPSPGALFSGKHPYGPMALKVRQKFPLRLVLVHSPWMALPSVFPGTESRTGIVGSTF